MLGRGLVCSEPQSNARGICCYAVRRPAPIELRVLEHEWSYVCGLFFALHIEVLGNALS